MRYAVLWRMAASLTAQRHLHGQPGLLWEHTVAGGCGVVSAELCCGGSAQRLLVVAFLRLHPALSLDVLLLLLWCAVEGDRQYYLSIHAGKLLEPQVRRPRDRHPP